MRSFRLASRLGTAAVLSALALSLVAAPSSAAGKTRVVDNDGKGTATNCDAGTKAFSKIQKAVDASGAGDIVRVCPGTYKEKISITGPRAGLQVLSVVAGKATIKDPNASDSYPYPPMVRIKDVANVTFKGFKVRTLSDAAYLPTSRDGIVADGATNVTIRGNDVGWAGPSSSTGELMNGIVARNGTTGKIIGNTIKDAYQDGIQAMGSGTSVTIQGNSLRWVAPGGGGAMYGIEVRDGAAATVKQNTLLADVVAPGQYSRLDNGIQLNGAASSTVVNGNTITDSVRGIYVVKGSGYTLNNNTISTRQTGIYLADMDGGTVAGNTVKAVKSPGNAITATEASNNNIIEQNVTTGTFGFGCVEQDGNDDGINNDWYANTGTGSPSGLCTYTIEEPA